MVVSCVLAAAGRNRCKWQRRHLSFTASRAQALLLSLLSSLGFNYRDVWARYELTTLGKDCVCLCLWCVSWTIWLSKQKYWARQREVRIQAPHTTERVYWRIFETNNKQIRFYFTSSSLRVCVFLSRPKKPPTLFMLCLAPSQRCMVRLAGVSLF